MRTEDERANLVIKLLAVLAIVLLIWGMASCKTVYVPVVEEHTKDSVRTEVRVDTFYREIKDSVVVQMPCNDSIEIAYVDRWHTDTKYIIREVHDTTTVAQVDKEPQIVEVEKVVTQNSGLAKFCIWFFFIVLAVVLGVIGWKLFKKFYLHI